MDFFAVGLAVDRVMEHVWLLFAYLNGASSYTKLLLTVICISSLKR